MAGSAFEGVEGDLNLSPRRAEWSRRHIAAETRRWLEEDARYFLHQALSTPCLNALADADGIYLEDLEGRRYMDFHGNSVHQVGFANPAVIAAIKAQLDALSFCTRRYTNVPAVELARKLDHAGRSRQVVVLPERRRGSRDGAPAGARRDRTAQDRLHVGLLSRRLARCVERRRRADVPR